MNIENIQSLLRESFKEDGIQKEDIFTSLKKTKNEFHEEEYDYEVSDNFKAYIYDLCSRTFFYDYSQNMIEKDDDEELEDIKKEIRYDTLSIQKEDIDELDIVYDWYLNDRVQFFLKENVNFFLDLLDDILNLSGVCHSGGITESNIITSI